MGSVMHSRQGCSIFTIVQRFHYSCDIDFVRSGQGQASRFHVHFEKALGRLDPSSLSKHNPLVFGPAGNRPCFGVWAAPAAQKPIPKGGGLRPPPF